MSTKQERLEISVYSTIYNAILREGGGRLRVRSTGLYREGDTVVVQEASLATEQATGRAATVVVSRVVKRGTGKSGDELQVKIAAPPEMEGA